MPKLGRRLRLRKKEDRFANYPDIPLNNPSGRYRKKAPSNLISTTKYTFWNFVPKNLYEQFRRMTNVYFLIIVIITLIPSISPLTPWTSILPLAFVLGVTALKEGYEDIQRWKADNTVNNKKYSVLSPDGAASRKRSKNLRVGDMIRIKSDQYLPADVIPLVSALPDGVCFIETAQLDGETNLKIYKAPPLTNAMPVEEILKLKGVLKPTPPDEQLYEWRGTLELSSGETASLKADNLLLRGAKLRNTDWVVGVVVYTGKATKLSLNQNLPPSKFSTIERRLNKCVVGIFIFKLCCVIVVAIGSLFFNLQYAQDSRYLDISSSSGIQAVKDFFAYFALLSFMIPMSLMVTLEVVKVIQGMFMEWDRKMALDPDNVEETGMKPKTTNLNDELALVKYIFSDKTGTLTENCMEFRKVSVGGTMYHDAGEGELLSILEQGPDPTLEEFLTALAVCQSVVPEEKDGELIYKAQSPDEEALCSGARSNGYKFTTRAQTEVTVEVRGQNQVFELLHEIPFSSDRARMTVIVRHPDGTYRVYCKGADSKMLPLLSGRNDQDIQQKTLDDIEVFSQEGLRTLIVGHRMLSDQEYEQFATLQREAENDLSDEGPKKLKEAAEIVENDLDLLGCTAIEDRLQKEVPETIHNLLRANIKVWMITGDKQATAENIGYSCKLLKHNMKLVRVIAQTPEECQEKLQAACERYCGRKLDHDLAVVIDGGTLKFALDRYPTEFLNITSICHSVVCCRVSPLQKAMIVRLMKEHTHEVCLSIGDGANDVSMIQEAHIGVGIFGKEGTQAARSSDYAIREFRHLRRLLTVHGRYSYIRNTTLIQYSIYKNASAFLVQFWYAFYCGYSATTIYDDWIVTFFNIFFTSIPPLFFAIFEKDIEEDVIEEYPEAYRYVQKGKLFTYSTLFTWMLFAIWNSLVFYFGGAILMANEPIVYSGRTYGLKLMGNIVSTYAIVTVILKVSTITNLWNVLVHVGMWGSIAIYVVIFCVESFIPVLFPRQYLQFYYMVSNPNFWAVFLIVVAICLTPDVLGSYIKGQFYPDDWQILQEAKHFNKYDRLKEDIRRIHDEKQAEEERAKLAKADREDSDV